MRDTNRDDLDVAFFIYCKHQEIAATGLDVSDELIELLDEFRNAPHVDVVEISTPDDQDGERHHCDGSSEDHSYWLVVRNPYTDTEEK